MIETGGVGLLPPPRGRFGLSTMCKPHCDPHSLALIDLITTATQTTAGVLTNMADYTALNAVLDNAQVPHQPLVVIVDSAVFSGLPVFKESLRRALNRQVQDVHQV